MYPTNPTRYPEFVADQVLTAQNLQDLFNYLDEQERLTRTNLIGIGIVCGLELSIHPAGTSIGVSKGVGVTSLGYLVAMPATNYTHFSKYNAEKEIYYDRFVDNGTKKQKFELWELAVAGTPQAETPLTQAFLKDKIVLVFVELLETGNKNCDPDSCDDKGITINVQFKVLLVEEKNVEGLIGFKNEGDFFKPGPKCINWPEVKLPRYNVPATTLPDAGTILKNYLTILNENFLQKIEDTLTLAYASTQLLVANELPTNPFSNLKEKLSFLYDGSLNLTQLVMVQYYYDFISDLLQGYEEMRMVCNKSLSICVPDANLFPRHLLLGAAFASNKSYRHYFIPSPAICGCHGMVGDLKFLMMRLNLLVQMVQIPPNAKASLANPKANPIRITPSKLGDVSLSQKAIPFYYDVLDNPPLFNAWNAQKTSLGKGNTNLSYWAEQYNATDDHVREPLKYDLEPYNFLRIEGHIGQPWQKAFQEIYKAKYKYRLPFEVVALNGDFRSLLALIQQSLANIGQALAQHPEQWRKILCYFTDIEMQYDMQAAELRCTIAKVMRFYYGTLALGSSASLPTQNIPVSALLRSFDPALRTRTNTNGAAFDEWYPTVKNTPYISPAQLIPAMSANFGAGTFISPLALMYYLEKIHEALPAGIIQVNIIELGVRLKDAVIVAEAIMKSIKNFAGDDKIDDPEIFLNLNAVIRICKGSLLLELYRNFLFRFYLFMANQSFAMYSFLNSGIQHKAGVPMGGTFIMVYHDALPITPITGTIFSAVATSDTASFAGNTAGNNANAKKSNQDALKTGNTRFEELDIAEKMFDTDNNIRKAQSIKDVGMFYLAAVVAAKEKEDALTDKELLDLVAEIPDGTVIADFYLPYICASECMPMSFVVLGGEEQPNTKVSVDIKPLEFCNGDNAEYPGKTSPAGGTLTGEGCTQNDDGFLFMPSAVNLNGGPSKKVTITYTVNGSSAQREVEVFANPIAKFNATVTPSAPTSVVVSNNSSFAFNYIWTFDTHGTSTLKDPPPFDFKKPGTYTIKLEAVSKVCGSSTHSVTIDIKPTSTVKTCVGLIIWVDAFKKLDANTDEDFKQFVELFTQYKDVKEAFLKITAAILALPQEQQTNSIRTFMPVSQLAVWLRMLCGLITQGPKSRRYAFELTRILEGILLFYACVQKGDINLDPNPTEGAFNFEINSCINRWKTLAPPLTTIEKEILKQMIQNKKTELANIQATEPTKTIYIDTLKKIIELLEPLV